MNDHHAWIRPSLDSLFATDPIIMPTTLAGFSDAIDHNLDLLTDPHTLTSPLDLARRLRAAKHIYLLTELWRLRLL